MSAQMKLSTGLVYAEDVAAHDPRRKSRESVGDGMGKREIKELLLETAKREVAAHGDK